MTRSKSAARSSNRTHVGRMAREHGSTFSSEQLEDLLSCLHQFLSFASGRWAGVALPVGFDTGGNRVFEERGMWRTADGPWNGSLEQVALDFLRSGVPRTVARESGPLSHRLGEGEGEGPPESSM